MTKKLNRGGLVVGKSHAEGGVDFVIEDTGKHVEMEGEEAVIPIEISDDPKEYEFTGTNYEILNKILKKANLSLSKKVTTVKSGDIVICIKSTWDEEKRTIKGTIRQILSAINESRGCKKIEDGAEVDKEGGKEKKKSGGSISGKTGSCQFWDFYKTHMSDDQKKLVPHPDIFDLDKRKSKSKKRYPWLEKGGDIDSNFNKYELKRSLISKIDDAPDELFFIRLLKNTGGISSTEIKDYGYKVDGYLLTERGIYPPESDIEKSFMKTNHPVFKKMISDSLTEKINSAESLEAKTEQGEEFFNKVPKLYAKDIKVGDIFKVQQIKDNQFVGEIVFEALNEDQNYIDGVIKSMSGEIVGYEGLEVGETVKEAIRTYVYGEIISTPKKTAPSKNEKSPEELAKEFLDKIPKEELAKIKKDLRVAYDEVIVSEQNKLNNLVSDKIAVDAKRTEGRNTLEMEERMKLGDESEKLSAMIINQENVILAFKNNGDTISFDDKKETRHSGIPYLSKINTDVIFFDEETILTDATPPYVPRINEEVFRSKGYVFDAIRISPDEYLLAVNGYNENAGGSYSYRTNSKEGGYHPSDAEQGYVIVTLDQLALINDYYFTKARAVNQKEADDKSKRQEEWYDKLPESRRASVLNQPKYWHALPVAVKKKITEEKWNTLTLIEKEGFYKPFKRYGAKRIASKLEDKSMWVSFHNMYERFVDPLAVQPKRGYANHDAFLYWESFRDMMKWKILDIGVQRIVESEVRKTALETSFGESNTNDVLKEEYGILVKRQDGSKINPIEIEQLKKAWVNVQKVFGNLSVQAKESNLKLSHTGVKYVFASKAAGMYVPQMGTIAVSAKFGESQLESTLAHETAHWIDHKIGEKNGKRHASDNFESTAGLVASTFRELMNKKSDSKYINATCECFARALEQYFAIEMFGDDASLMFSTTPFDHERKYFVEDSYVSKSDYEGFVKPLIKRFFEEHKLFFKYDVEIESEA